MSTTAGAEFAPAAPAVDHRSPWRIGDVTVSNRVVLAPLAGIGNWCVRLQAKRFGAGLTVSEMISSHAVHFGNRRTLDQMLRIHPDEHPVAIQLYGADPAIMARAADRVARAGADIIDINMGCPVRKVRKTGAGASLMGDHERAEKVVRAVRAAAGLPVTVKLRSGLFHGGLEGVELARRLSRQGLVDAIAIHPRSADRRHAGPVDRAIVADLVRTVGTPIIASGQMRSAAAAREALTSTSCAAIMVARGAIGNPWIFSEILRGCELAPLEDEILDEMEWVICRLRSHAGDRHAHAVVRSLLPPMLKRMGVGREGALKVMEAPTLESALTFVESSLVQRARTAV